MLNLINSILDIIIILLAIYFIYSLAKTEVLLKKLEAKIDEHFKNIPRKK
jgi:hypothetical protein